MKKTLIVVLGIMVLFAFCVSAVQKTQRPPTIPSIDVNLISQIPDPAEPGKFVDVRFKFDNNGTVARDVEVEILPEYPFSLYSGDALRNIGTLQSRQKGDAGVVVKYRLRVDENAIEGDNELKIRFRVDEYAWIEPEEFLIGIQTFDAILAVESIISEDSIIPGVSSLLKIRIKNMADSLLKDIKVKLNLGGVPLVPIGSTDEKSLYQLDSKESYDIEFNLVAEPDAESGIYKVPLKLEYFDELGKSYLKNLTIGLIIGAKPDLRITLDSTDIYQSQKSGEIVVKIVNKGVTDIKFANVKLSKSDDYRILTNNEVYVGNIDSDDYETAEFTIFVGNTKEKKIILPIFLEYKDANNLDYSNNIKLELPLYDASEAKQFGLVQGNNTVGILIIIIIVVIGLFIYNKKRKGKNKKV